MVIFGVNSGLDGVSWCISWLQIPGTCPDPPNARIQTKISTVVCCRSVRDHGLLGGCWCQKTPRSGSLLACRYMVLTNTEIAPLPAPILRSACPLHPRGSPHSRAPPAPALSPQEGDELHLRPLTAPPNTTRHPRNTCTPTDIQRPRKWSLTGRKWSPKDDQSSRAAAQGTGAERRANRVMLASDRQVG